jgi:ribosomal protein S18 acetylase RimI-like enzyme
LIEIALKPAGHVASEQVKSVSVKPWLADRQPSSCGGVLQVTTRPVAMSPGKRATLGVGQMSDIASEQVSRQDRRGPLVPASAGSVRVRDVAPAAGPPVLDNPVWASLMNHHAALAQRVGQAARYPPDVSPFVALGDQADHGVWSDLESLLGHGEVAALTGAAHHLPRGWDVVEAGEGVQLVDTSLQAVPDPEAVVLGPADVPEMLDLVERTRPGPFLARTVELGTYLGLRRRGVLVAMAGERLHPPGWTEISAVCTDPDYRGQGLATRLVSAVAAGIRGRGETPFLHAAATNTNAIRLYESIGFTLRRRTPFTVVRTPVAVGRTTIIEERA